MVRFLRTAAFALAAATVWPGSVCLQAQTIVTDAPQATSVLLASDGNLYAAYTISSTPPYAFGFYSVTPGGAYQLLNSSLPGQIQLCLETPAANLLGVMSVPASDGAQLVSVNFAGQVSALTNLSSGLFPGCPAIASDGNYYGQVANGGVYDKGYLYQLTPAGKMTDIYDFTGGQDGKANSSLPLLEAANGNLYGVSWTNAIEFSPSKGLIVLAPAADTGLESGLFQAADGNVYFGDYNVYPQSNIIYQINGTSDTVNVFYTSSNSIYQVFLNGAGLVDSFEQVEAEGGCPSAYMVMKTLDASGGSSQLFQLGGPGSISSAMAVLGGNGSYEGSWELETEDYESSCAATSTGMIFSTTPSTPKPIAMSMTPTNLLLGHSSTLTWQVNNAFSKTMQQCYGYGALSGKVFLNGTKTITPTQAGIQTTAIVCGGTETSFVTLSTGVTQLALSASQTSIGSGTPVTLTAQIGNVGTPTPTGSVQFLYGSTILATSKVNAQGTATFTASTNGIPPGTYDVTAKYLGDSSYAPATSSAVAITVMPKQATTITLTPASQSEVVGQPATLNVSVSGTASQTPTGSVEFYSGTLALGSATLTPGTSGSPSTATFSASTAGAPAGTYPVVAKYQGDPYNLPSTSSSVSVTLKNGDSVSLTASPNPVPASNSFQLTATATGTAGTPTGTVFFYAGTQELASASLNGSGVAQITVAANTLSAGSYQVTADYAGDSKNPAVNSPAITLTVQ